VDEVDEGTVELAWRTDGGTLELHSVRAWLDTYADREIAHEDLTEELHAELAAMPKIDDVQVTTHWNTAGFTVTARAVR
jgi:NADPH-dependent 7-cyano-7-deazaguanine reductase QueF